MTDPQTTTTLSQVVALVLAVLLGGGGKVGIDRLRRNGRAGRDAQVIVAAIHAEAAETRNALGQLTAAISDLRAEVARRGPG